MGDIVLSSEQQAVIDAALAGRDVLVEATVGSGKTTVIQQLCNQLAAARPGVRILYLTFSRLLKAEAQRTVTNAYVQNYHGFVYPPLQAAGIRCGIGEAVQVFNQSFEQLKQFVPVFDVVVVDEYQDINEVYARLLVNLKSLNPDVQVVMVGDPDQKVQANSRLDAPAFAREICHDPVELTFTQSFRIGPGLAGKLATSWGRTIVGANPDQNVEHISLREAAAKLAALGDQLPQVLCLGQRNGQMVHVLNALERLDPSRWNKRTVYASIRNSDDMAADTANAAVFTTFDASKGMERDHVFVFDFTPRYFKARTRFPDTDLRVIRNIFLVAASRGKANVFFVEADGGDECLGAIPTATFTNLPELPRPQFTETIAMQEAFDFKFSENVTECVDLLGRKRLDDGLGTVLDIERSDGMIDLSPVVGNFAEAVFFRRYSQQVAMDFATFNRRDLREKFDMAHFEPDADIWRHCLSRTAAETRQDRYLRQVECTVTAGQEAALTERMGELLDRDDQVQVPVTWNVTAVAVDGSTSPLRLSGRMDAVHNGVVFEVKFTSELSAAMFCQLGLYLLASGLERGVLWNVRTDERWEVTVPDREAFANAVVRCVTKQAYERVA